MIFYSLPYNMAQPYAGALKKMKFPLHAKQVEIKRELSDSCPVHYTLK